MHSNVYYRDGKEYTRIGVAYRMYIDGRITNLDLLSKVIAKDIIDIWGKAPALRNYLDDINIIKHIKLQFSDGDLSDELLLLLLVAYDFGFMRGSNDMRKKLRMKS